MANHIDQLHPRIQAIDPDTGLLTPFFFRWLIQVYERIGGPDDFIADTQNGELYESGITDSKLTELTKDFQDLQKELDTQSDSRFAVLDSRITDLQNEFDCSPIWTTNLFKPYQLIYTSTAFTTNGKQIVIVTSNVTITLNANPVDGEVAIIKRATTAGEVIISGSIDGASSYTLLMNYECVQCLYSESASEWLII